MSSGSASLIRNGHAGLHDEGGPRENPIGCVDMKNIKLGDNNSIIIYASPIHDPRQGVSASESVTTILLFSIVLQLLLFLLHILFLYYSIAKLGRPHHCEY